MENSKGPWCRRFMMYLANSLAKCPFGLYSDTPPKRSDHTLDGEGTIHGNQQDVPLLSRQIKDISKIRLHLAKAVPKISTSVVSELF